MPIKKKRARKATRDLPSIPKELIEQFVSGPLSAEAIQDASMAFKKALIERALGATTLATLRARSAFRNRVISAMARVAKQC